MAPEGTQDIPGPARAKTYKRELATAMLAYLAAFFVWGVNNETALRIGEFLTLPVFGFATAAFGLDAFAKQLREQVAQE